MTDKIDTSADLVVRLRDHGQHEREEMNHTWRRFRVERLEAADAIEALRAEVERLRSALQASVAFSDGVANELDIEMSETVFEVHIMPRGDAVSVRSWASVQAEARAALKGGDA